MTEDPQNETPAETASRIHKKWNTTTGVSAAGVVIAVFVGEDSEFKVLALLTVLALLGFCFYSLMTAAKIKTHLAQEEFELVIRRYGWIIGQTP